MKASYLLSSLIFSAATLFSCADDGGEDNVGNIGLYAGEVSDEDVIDLSLAVECDALTPCDNGLECLYVGALELGHPICVDGGTVCDLLDCGPDGECVIAESYPGQVMCSGTGGGGGPGDDCAVSSDGTTWCPDGGDGDDGGEGGTSPGNPGI